MASSKSQIVISKGIFHGLPTFPQYDGKKLTAIVTGANGISGSAMVKVLLEAPERWEKIYAMSRRPPPSMPGTNVVPIAVDFLNSIPEQIAKIFKEKSVKADYVFFSSYVQPPPAEGQGLWSDHEAMNSLNLALLSNFLEALPLAELAPKRILLQTGAKRFGLHLGPTPTPMEESDPRHGIEANFYWSQEDALWKFCKKTGTDWVVTSPGFILGAVETAAMNIIYPLSVYAAIQAHLGKALDFPSDVPAWDAEKHLSTAMLIAYHAEWALLTPAASKQILNISDSSSFAWGKFWPTLANWYHIPAGKPSDDSKAYGTITMPHSVPPRGFGGPGIIHPTFSFFEWSKKAEVLAAWEEIKEKYDLTGSPFGTKAMDTFGLIDGEILGSWGRVISMDKNRKLGWNGFVDTKESIKQVIEDMASLKVVPPL